MLETPAEILHQQAAQESIPDDQQQINSKSDAAQEKAEESKEAVQFVPGSVKYDFYENVLAAISDCMLNESSIQKPEYFVQIVVFFKTIISKFLLRDIENSQMLQISANLFDWDRKLHSYALSNLNTSNIQKWEHSILLETSRLHSELEWRSKLQVGEKIDVLRRVRTKGIEVKAWGRGTVVYKGNAEDEEATDVNMESPNNGPSAETAIDVKFELSYIPDIRRYSLMTLDIAPLGTYTDDYDWRYDLKVGDEIDCMDQEKDWFKSTVIDHNIQANQEGEPVPIITVGFRTYDEEGTKWDEDDDKKRFFGWSKIYDESFSVTDPKVQKLGTAHLQYLKVESNHKLYERPVYTNDKEDVLYDNKIMHDYGAKRDRYFVESGVINDALNVFGRQGGIDKLINIFEEAAEGKRSLNLKFVVDICSFLSRSLPLWHRQFMVRFVPKFTDVLLKALSWFNKDLNDQNKNNKGMVIGVVQDDTFDRSLLENLINIIVDPIWKTYYTKEMFQKILNVYRVEIGATMLHLQKLQTRIDGIKHINYTIQNVTQSYPMYKLLQAQQLIDMLKQLGVFRNIFGENTHFQLINRSEQLIKLFFNEKRITPEEIDMIWTVCTKQGQQNKLEVYKIIIDVLSHTYQSTMTDETKEYFIDKFKGMDPSELLEKDIELLTELGKKVGGQFRQADGYVKKVADYLWSIAVLEKDFPRNIAVVARKKFCDQVQYWDDNLKENYVNSAIENIKAHNLPLQSLKIAIKMIEKMNTSNYPQGKRTRRDFTQDMIDNQDFIKILIDDLNYYIEFANGIIDKGELTVDTVKTYEHEGKQMFPHYKNIRSRLKIIRKVLIFADRKLTSEQMEKIWDSLIIKSNIREHDQNVFFNWFKVIMYQEKTDNIEGNVIINLYRSKILSFNLQQANFWKINGFECIIKMFIQANVSQDKLLDLDPPTQALSNNNQSQSWKTGNYQQNQNTNYNDGVGSDSAINRLKFNKFSIKVLPRDLEGINILWKLLIVCETTDKDNTIFTMVQRALINSYTNIYPDLESQKQQISDDFVMDSLQCLNSICKNELIIKTEKQKKETIKQLCSMITSFFEHTEQSGLGNIQMHKQIDEGFFIRDLLFDTNLKLRKGIDSKFIKIDAHSNLSIWMLKQIIAKHTNKSPLCIDIKRQDFNKQCLKEAKNSQILVEFGLQDGEKFLVTQSQIQPPIGLPLLDKEGKMVKELKDIITEIYDTFSEEKTKEEIIEITRMRYGSIYDDYNNDDSDLNFFLREDQVPDSERLMTRALCAQYAEAVTTLRGLRENDYRVNDMFKEHAKTYRNLITRTEFLKWYQERSEVRCELVRSNLLEYGYYPNYQKKLDPSTLTYENDARITRDSKSLPRSKISTNEQIFEGLLQLVEESKGDEAEGIWNLINNLETNKTVQEKILNNENISELFNLEKSNLYKVLYCIQIIQSLIFEFKNREEGQVTVYIEPSQQPQMSIPVPAASDSVQDIDNSQRQQPIKLVNQDQVQMAGEDKNANDALLQYQENFPSIGDLEQDKPSDVKPAIGYGQAINIETVDNLPGERDQNMQQIDSSSGAAPIPLGYQGPFVDQTVSNGNPRNHDIPMAPKSQAADVGAPNQNNTVNHNLTINNFTGEIKKAPLRNYFENSQNDGRRKAWLPQFLAKDGLQLLIELLKNLSSLNINQNQQTSRIAKKCLSEVMECVRILLICLFCSEFAEAGMTLDLTRKISFDPSSEVKKEQPQKTTNKLQQVQENTMEEMKPLIEMMSFNKSDMSQRLVDGLESFQSEILGILAELIERPSGINKDENTEIIAAGLSIWMSCLVKQPSIFNILIDNFNLESSDQNNNIYKFVNNMINRGLVSTESRVRETYESVIRYVIESVQRDTLKELPLCFFIKLLLNKLDHVLTLTTTTIRTYGQSRNFFVILREFLPKYFVKLLGPNPISPVLDPSVLIKQLIQKLNNYQSFEKSSGIIEDQTLTGMINLVTIILQYCPRCLTASEIQELSVFILEKCLFSMNFHPFDSHITKDVELGPIEKANINKCHSRESKLASYNLLLTICKNFQVPDIVNDILQNYWLKQINRVDKPEKPGFAPSSDGRSMYGFSGIKNLGSVCYMNSMMQQFYNIPTFRFGLLAADDKQDPNVIQHENKDIDDNLLHQVMNEFAFLQLSDRQYYNPAPLCFSFKTDGQPTNVREQKDAQEFLNFWHERTESLLKNTSQKYLIENVFGGKTSLIDTCMNCGNVRQRTEPFSCLTLQVQNRQTIHNSLTEFCASETITDYQCDACNKRVDLQRRNSVQSLPNTLILHLHRLAFDFNTMRRVKHNDRLEFPNVLSMKDYVTDHVIAKDKKQKEVAKKKEQQEKKLAKQKSAEVDLKKEEDRKQEEGPEIIDDSAAYVENMNQEMENIDIQDEAENGVNNQEYEYKLVGVVCHMGSAEAGHYFSYINTERDKMARGIQKTSNEGEEEWLATENQNWLEFNDAKVAKFQFSGLDQNCFGGRGNQNAYMLFYEKRIKNKIKIVVPEEALDCDGTTVSRADNHLFSVFPNLADQINQKQVKIEIHEEKDQKKEHTVLLDFNEAQKFIPHHIYQMVHQDNQKFLCEKQVFSESFYKCTLELLQTSIQMTQYTQDISQDANKLEMIYKVLDRVVFDLVVNSEANKELGNLTDILILILSKSDDVVMKLVNDRVFAPPEQLGKDEKNFIEMLATHSEKNVREMASTILLFVIGRLMQIGGDKSKELIDKAINNVLEQMENECQKHWQRLDTYFTFIYQLAKSSFVNLKMLVEKDVIKKLVDLMTKYNQNSLLYVQTAPPLEKLVTTMSFIVRSIPCVVDPNDKFNIRNDAEIDKETQMQILLSQRGASQYHIPLEKSFSQAELAENQNTILVLSEDSILALFIRHKKYKQFYENITKSGFDIQNFAQMIGHLCYGNKEYSVKIAKQMLKGINMTQADELGPVLEILSQYLSVEDEYFDHRLEWIFGLPNVVVQTGSYQSVYNQPPKIGVALADRIGTQVYGYFSPIFKAGSSNFRKESALQAMLSGRRQQSKSVLFSIQAVLNCALKDPKMRIIKYMKEIETPNYQYARYYDWIKPWLASEVEVNTRNQNMSSYRAELELSINVLTLIEEVDRVYAEKFPDCFLDNGVITYPEDDEGPKPYLIWDIQGADIVDRKEDLENKVNVFVTKLTCTVSLSYPNGTDNYLLMDEFSNKGGNNQQSGGNNQGSHRINKRSFARGGRRGGILHGRGRNSNISKPRYQQNALQIKTVKTKTDGKMYMDLENDADSEVESPEQQKGGVKKNVRFDEETEATFENIEADNGVGQNMQGTQSMEPQDQDLNVDTGVADLESGVSQDIPISSTGEQQMNVDEVSDAYHVAAEDYNISQSDQQNQDDMDPKYQSPCVIMFKVDNYSNLNKVVGITIRPKDGGNVNFRCPLSEVICEVYSSQNQEVVNISKIDPDKDWGEFEWDFRIIDKQKENQQVGQYPAGGDTNAVDMNVIDESANMVVEQGCPKCTFINESYATECMLCGHFPL